MSKVIKVEDKVYTDLDRLRVGRQTFSDVISNLLDARNKVWELVNVLEGQYQFRKNKVDQLDAMTEARAERSDLESRRLT